MINRKELSKFCTDIAESILTSKNNSIIKNINIITQIDPNLPKDFYSDETKIMQILLNLLSNSIKFMNYGFIKLIIKKKVSLTKNTIKFKVKDTGCGVDDNIVKHLFEEFYKTDRNNNIYGSGLGLAIVKDLTKLIGSKIVYKRANNITTFSFEIELELDKKS